MVLEIKANFGPILRGAYFLWLTVMTKGFIRKHSAYIIKFGWSNLSKKHKKIILLEHNLPDKWFEPDLEYEFSIPDQNIKASSFCTKNKFAKRNIKSTSFEMNREKLKWPDPSSPK